MAWDRRTGQPYGTGDRLAGPPHRRPLRRARATAATCRSCATRTGLVLDPYFSATKFEWLLARSAAIPIGDDLALGTIDAWLIWNLTGGAVHATDVTNASRTMLFDIRTRAWSDGAVRRCFGVPDRRPARGAARRAAASAPPSSRRGVPGGIPISGIAGDQQAALFGQACFDPGMAKNTYGTGSFVLLNVGPTLPAADRGHADDAWRGRSSTARVAYALEGAIFVTGAAIQWLRDGLGVIDDRGRDRAARRERDRHAAACTSCRRSPASARPWWDPYARGTILGITRGSTKAHLARAVVESMAYQTRDAIDAMVKASGTPITDLRVDGGASVMDFSVADASRPARRAGAAPEGPGDDGARAPRTWRVSPKASGDLDAIRDMWQLDATFEPADDRTFPDLFHAQWLRAVERSRGWASKEPT